MLLPYFLTSLKSIDIMTPPPMSTSDFIRLSEDCLSTEITADLERLHAMTFINHTHDDDIFAQYAAELKLDPPGDGLIDPLAKRYLYWAWLKSTSHASFIKAFADDAIVFYQVLAHLLASHHGVANDEFPATASWLDDTKITFVTHHPELVQHHAYAALEQALMDHDPATLENEVNRLLFALADEKLSDDALSSDHVFAYFIKLMLCERRASRDKERGQAILASILVNVSEGAHHERA